MRANFGLRRFSHVLPMTNSHPRNHIALHCVRARSSPRHSHYPCSGKWGRSAALVKREGTRFVLDNVVFDVERNPAGYLPPPFSFEECKGPRGAAGR